MKTFLKKWLLFPTNEELLKIRERYKKLSIKGALEPYTAQKLGRLLLLHEKSFVEIERETDDEARDSHSDYLSFCFLEFASYAFVFDITVIDESSFFRSVWTKKW